MLAGVSEARKAGLHSSFFLCLAYIDKNRLLCSTPLMTKKRFIFLWSTHRSVGIGIFLIVTCCWAQFIYPTGSDIWYYWPFFITMILFLIVAFLSSLSLIALHEKGLSLYRLCSITHFQEVSISYEQKVTLGSGFRQISYWPITFFGLSINQNQQVTNTTKTVFSGKIALKYFKTICFKYRPDLFER